MSSSIERRLTTYKRAKSLNLKSTKSKSTGWILSLLLKKVQLRFACTRRSWAEGKSWYIWYKGKSSKALKECSVLLFLILGKESPQTSFYNTKIRALYTRNSERHGNGLDSHFRGHRNINMSANESKNMNISFLSLITFPLSVALWPSSSTSMDGSSDVQRLSV
jgi:hypothetical protein